MAWGISTDAAGRLRITPAAACKIIAGYYAKNVNLDEVDGYPFLQQLLIHNEAEIIGGPQLEETSQGFDTHYGWSALDGRFLRMSEDGRVVRDKDRTIAELLAALHIAVAEKEAAARAAPPFGDFIDSSLIRMRLEINASFLTNTQPLRGPGRPLMPR